MKTQLRQIFWVFSLSTTLLIGLMFTLSNSNAAASSEFLKNSTAFTSSLDRITSTTAHTIYLPLVSKSYQWHKVGGALYTGNTLSATQVFTAYQSYWFHVWDSIICDDVRDPTRSLGRQVPMVRSSTITNFLAVAQYGPCNDGRPILVLNEPEGAGQDNLVGPNMPRALYIITSVANSTWKGPVYVGGIIVSNEQYITDLLTLWANAHAGSRLIPGVAGFHVHPYMNLVGGYSPWLTATQFMPLVDQNVQMVRDFIAHRKAEGYSGSTIISEFGWLGRTLSLGRRDNDMVAIFDRYVQDFDTVPEIQGWAWYSDWCPTTLKQNDYDLSDLVFGDGSLTPTGVKFREKLGLYP
jgi:hypothetical protein